MDIKEAIVLAGGLGTRLRAAVPDLPKCMAPVNDRPFLAYIIDYYSSQGIEKFIFSLGYKHEIIVDWLKKNYPSLAFECAIEREPLGTGGAIQLAMEKAKEKDVLVINGDTLFKIKLAEVAAFHKTHLSACTLSLKPMTDFDRYGAVEVNKEGQIENFQEKKFYAQGLINGGVYVLNAGRFRQQRRPDKFSFEKDYLERSYSVLHLYGCIQDEYFIDIGIPEDLQRAQSEMP